MRRMVDGLSMQSQGTSVSAFAANSGMIQEVTVDTAAGSAEQSAGGVRMNIIPREGGNTFTGSLFAAGTSDKLAERQHRPGAARLAASSRRARSRATGKSTRRSAGRSCAIGSGSSRRGATRRSTTTSPARCATPTPATRTRSPYAPDTSFRGSRDTLWRDVNGRAHVAGEPEEQGEPVHRLPGSLQLLDSRALTSPRGVGRLQVPVEAAGDRHLHGAGHQQGADRSRLAHKPEDWGYFTPRGR